jgi:hypothetical protein
MIRNQNPSKHPGIAQNLAVFKTPGRGATGVKFGKKALPI